MDLTALNAAQHYTDSRPATEPKPTSGGIQQHFADLFQSFTNTVRSGEATAQAAMAGGADPHSLVQALAQTELAIETAVSVRDKVVEAYQEILRMPI